VTYWECGEKDIARGTVPIGYPMANTQIYIVDDAGQPCPPLAKGELLIGGTCLATSYWKREELTKERFIPNPFGAGRLYRTGDWGRYGLDGAIEYLERKDTQTKIRGVRIELGEIETQLRKLDAIENAVVIKGKTLTGHECLIAYYTEKPGISTDALSLREGLRKHLPETVIPEYYRKLEGFPMNEVGKLDRKALPVSVIDEGALVKAATTSPFAPELDAGQALVAKLWEKTLGMPCNDTNRNFFDSGGSSMSLLVLRRLLEETFGGTVGIAELFRHPTIAGMAELFRPEAPTPNTGIVDTAVSERARMQRQKMRGFGPRRRGDE
jgi:hypothetical protein